MSLAYACLYLLYTLSGALTLLELFASVGTPHCEGWPLAANDWLLLRATMSGMTIAALTLLARHWPPAMWLLTLGFVVWTIAWESLGAGLEIGGCSGALQSAVLLSVLGGPFTALSMTAAVVLFIQARRTESSH
jgi:hypothetical protein